MSQSAVSRRVSTLESSLNVALFHRHARGLKMTGGVNSSIAQFTMCSPNLQWPKRKCWMIESIHKGILKINTTVAFGSVWLTSRINAFVERFPDIEVSLVLADNELDLSMREADVAIRMTMPTQPDLIQRQLMTIRYNVYAAPEYLKRFGMPKSSRNWMTIG